MDCPDWRWPITIGALGNSITFGAGVGANRSWPVQLQKSLSARFGHNESATETQVGSIRMLNGAIRASSADFAALCYDEIWRRAGWSHAPPLDIAIIDYSYTSSVGQLAALVDKLQSLSSPPEILALLYCPHQSWQHTMYNSLRKAGVRIPSTPAMIPSKASSNATALTPNASRASRLLLETDSSRLAAKVPRSLLQRIGPRLAWAHATGRLPHAPHMPSLAFRAVAAAVYHHRDAVTRTDEVAMAMRRRPTAVSDAEWMQALEAVASGECLGERLQSTRAMLEAKGVPYTTNEAQLRMHPHDVMLTQVSPNPSIFIPCILEVARLASSG